MLGLFKKKTGYEDSAEKLYGKIVEQAREPVFYELYGVPDTIDGRFDLICVHAFLIMNRLLDTGREGRKLSQALFDVMFRDMDQSLRESGVGDLSLPRHVKRMMKGFNGRMMAYEEAIVSDDPYDLVEVLRRNLYGTAPHADEDTMKVIALYIHESALYLGQQGWPAFVEGSFEFKAMHYDVKEEYDDGYAAAGMVA